jgi:hypothetical protein
MLKFTITQNLNGLFERRYQAGIKKGLRRYLCALVEYFQTLQFHKSIIGFEDIGEAAFMRQSFNQRRLPTFEAQGDSRPGA